MVSTMSLVEVQKTSKTEDFNSSVGSPQFSYFLMNLSEIKSEDNFKHLFQKLEQNQTNIPSQTHEILVQMLTFRDSFVKKKGQKRCRGKFCI